MSSNVKSLLSAAMLVLLTGCGAVVPMAPKERDAASKEFRAPAVGMASVYIYRADGPFGRLLTKRLSIDGKVIGETGPGVFFHCEIEPGKHVIATQAEFGESTIALDAEANKVYFFHQYIKMGTFKGSAGIEAVSEATGKEAVLQCTEGQ